MITHTPTSHRRRVLVAALLVASCSGRVEAPFVPGPPPQPIWAINSVTIYQSPNARIAGNGAAAGGRDDLGTMHLLWEDGTALRHGFVPLTQTTWTVRNIATFASAATVRRPTLAILPGGLFLAAWLEQLGGTYRIVVSRSIDHGANWDTPLSLLSTATAISSPSLYVYQRANGTTGAVIAWSDPPTLAPGQVYTSVWRGTTWSASDWTPASAISGNTTGSARDVSLAGRGEDVVAAWADTRGAPAGGTGVFITTSSNGGLSWGAASLAGVPIGASAVGTEPAVAVGADRSVVLTWTNGATVYASRSTDRGVTFSLPRRMGDGFAARPAVSDGGRVAIGWTNGAGASADETAFLSSLALSYDNLLTVAGPSEMPGSATTRARASTRAFLSGTTLDMIWVDVSGGTRALTHRTAALP